MMGGGTDTRDAALAETERIMSGAPALLMFAFSLSGTTTEVAGTWTEVDCKTEGGTMALALAAGLSAAVFVRSISASLELVLLALALR